MNELFLKIVNMSISASWLVLAVLVLRFVLKKAPKWVNVLLWGMVALRLICPFSMESALSLISAAQTIPSDIMVDRTPEISTGIPALNRLVNPVLTESFAPAPEDSANPLQILIPVVSAIWLVGMVLPASYTAVGYWRLRRRVATAVRYRDNIYQSENVPSPFVLGILRPRIYLPFQLDGQNLEYVVAHEGAHIRRKDHWWKPLGFLLLIVYWFNPLMWLAYILLCRDIEMACDEKVIKDLDSEQRAFYTRALVLCSASRRRIAACPLAFGEVGVKERVKSVMNYKKPAFWMILVAVIVCVIAAVCFLTDPVSEIRNPWVQEYTPGGDGMVGNVDKEEYEKIHEDFAIGADQYGRAVFKNPDQAFDTMVELYAQGLALIREENDLPSISRNNYAAYKTYGWQVTSGSEEAQAQAAFVTGFLDIYENSFEKEPLKADSKSTTPEPARAQMWFDDYHSASFNWSGLREIDLDAFPNVTFRWSPEKVEAITRDGAVTPLYTGLPIWSVYFADLTGDGLPELCSSLSIGSGIVDDRVVIYDYANGTGYTLEDRGEYDYTLSMENGMLLVTKRADASEEVLEIGYMIYQDETIQLVPLETEKKQMSDALDSAVSRAILEHYASDNPDGLIRVESHMLLEHVGLSGTPLVGQTGHIVEETVYLLVLHERYSAYGGELEVVGGSYGPAAITFSVSQSGEYTLKEYWEPRDGSHYTEDIQDKFPDSAEKDVGNADDYVDALEQENRKKAQAYLDNLGSADAGIGALLNPFGLT